MRCHDCSCHISPPCNQCVECAHIDASCEDDCQTCDCLDRTPEPIYVPTPAEVEAWAGTRTHDKWRQSVRFRCLPYSNAEWGYACVRYTIRPEVTGERMTAVVRGLIANHTYFGHRWDGRTITIYVD